MKSAGSSAAKSVVLDRMRQHRRAERRRIARRPACRRGLRARRTARRRAAPARARASRSRSASLSPSAAAAVLASRAETPMRKRAGDELQQRPAAGLVERVEPARELRRQLRLAERGRASRPPRRATACAFGLLRRIGRPHQRDRLRQVADIVVGQLEQHRIGALGDQRADHAGLGVLERQRAGQRRERVAALRVGRGAEIVRRSAAACRCGRARRRGGRAARRTVHAVPGSRRSRRRWRRRSRPRRHSRRWRAAAPCSPRVVHQCTSASSWPCVTQISRRAGRGDGRRSARPSRHDRRSPAAARRRAGARARAPASSRRRSTSPDRESAATRGPCSADGGQSTIAPASSALFAPRTGRSSPRSMPRLS